MNRCARVFFLIATSVVLGACGSKSVHFMQEGVEAEEKVKIAGEARLTRAWRYSLGEGFGASDRPLIPAFASDRVFAAEPEGRVVALNLQNGESIWRREFDSHLLLAGVGSGDGLVIVANAEGEVIALDSQTGETVWVTPVGREVLARPVVTPGVVVVRTGDGQVLGIDSANGEISWRVSRSIPGLSVRGVSTPLVNGRGVVAGFSTGRLVAINVDTGRENWDLPISQAQGDNEIQRLIDIDTDPILVGDVLYVGAFQGGITALSLTQQDALWSRPVSTLRNFGYDTENLYATNDEGVVLALDRLTGESRWSQSGLRGRGVTTPAVVGDYVVVGDYEGFLYLMERETGALVGRNRTGGDAVLELVSLDGNAVIALTEDGSVILWRRNEVE